MPQPPKPRTVAAVLRKVLCTELGQLAYSGDSNIGSRLDACGERLVGLFDSFTPAERKEARRELQRIVQIIDARNRMERNLLRQRSEG